MVHLNTSSVGRLWVRYHAASLDDAAALRSRLDCDHAPSLPFAACRPGGLLCVAGDDAPSAAVEINHRFGTSRPNFEIL